MFSCLPNGWISVGWIPLIWFLLRMHGTCAQHFYTISDRSSIFEMSDRSNRRTVFRAHKAFSIFDTTVFTFVSWNCWKPRKERKKLTQFQCCATSKQHLPLQDVTSCPTLDWGNPEGICEPWKLAFISCWSNEWKQIKLNNIVVAAQ